MFLQDFLECYSNMNGGGSKDVSDLESRIADAAYAAEDIIESHIVDQIQSHGKNISLIDLYQGLQKVQRDLDLIVKEVTKIKEKLGTPLDQPHVDYSVPVGSVRSPSTGMVGLDDVLLEVMDKLTAQQTSRQIISIVGMDGIVGTYFAKVCLEKKNVPLNLKKLERRLPKIAKDFLCQLS
ncbi:hypothetical protein PHJA_002524500 [Phtheirospermum japonicum]|uniref:Uncharacterized protein n=1 Tax=Phtheirospermum japonicum TaxID=374723 RepID=A0A830CX41_9LAMI|nr:hypothetical protein PHJA_002524500 [Phtheirospermum japonicum]